jgi:hypothetical protein
VASRSGRLIPWNAFTQRVRRHRPSELAGAIGELTAYQASKNIAPPQERLLLPWALAAAVREAFLTGNEYRASGVTPRDLQQICEAYNAVDTRFTGSTLGEVHAFLLRTSYEQFPFQDPDFAKMNRPVAMLEMTTAATNLITPSVWRRVLGCDLRDFLSAGFILSAATQNNRGRFSIDHLDSESYAPILEITPRLVIETALRTRLSMSVDEFRSRSQEARSLRPELRKYDFNPLVARPLFDLGGGEYLAPVSQLTTRPLSVAGLYFAGLQALPNDEASLFTIDMGMLFEQYVGRQLASLPDVAVHPEVEYERGRKTVDWFVVPNEGPVLLVEAKATPPRVAGYRDLEVMSTDVTRAVGKAYEQIARSADLLKSGHASLRHIPNDRGLRGLAVTLEPYRMVNDHVSREGLPDPGIPTLACSAKELEDLVTVGQAEPAVALLASILDDEERRTWDLTASLGDWDTGIHNPILEEAWLSFPWVQALEGHRELGDTPNSTT